MMHTIQAACLNGGPQFETCDLSGKMPQFAKRFQKSGKEAAGPIPRRNQGIFAKPNGEVRKDA